MVGAGFQQPPQPLSGLREQRVPLVGSDLCFVEVHGRQLVQSVFVAWPGSLGLLQLNESGVGSRENVVQETAVRVPDDGLQFAQPGGDPREQSLVARDGPGSCLLRARRRPLLPEILRQSRRVTSRKRAPLRAPSSSSPTCHAGVAGVPDTRRAPPPFFWRRPGFPGASYRRSGRRDPQRRSH